VGIKTWKTHWTRAMENMLDAPHLPFVHRRTIGMQMRWAMTRQSVMEVGLEQTPHGFRSEWHLDGKSSGAFLEFTRPNKMSLGVPIPGKTLGLHVWCVPVDHEHTRMIAASTRNFGLYNPLVRLFDLINHLIIHEDKAVVESSRPLEVPKPGVGEVSVATDRATLAFRAYYLNTLKPSVALPPKRAAAPSLAAPVALPEPAAPVSVDRVDGGGEQVPVASAAADLAERLAGRA
jgi:phenylpropionate dioxygenase-like ring-hydroxylating dioxygenase large terminal subunit